VEVGEVGDEADQRLQQLGGDRGAQRHHDGEAAQRQAPACRIGLGAR